MTDAQMREDTWLLAQEKGGKLPVVKKQKETGSLWDAAGPSFSALLTLPVLMAH